LGKKSTILLGKKSTILGKKIYQYLNNIENKELNNKGKLSLRESFPYGEKIRGV